MWGMIEPGIKQLRVRAPNIEVQTAKQKMAQYGGSIDPSVVQDVLSS